uniref:Uncharacterized protein n=1 Tax=Rhizophora mucronata TaxID=61149 RepID=A0A2P2K9S3_RHIMU
MVSPRRGISNRTPKSLVLSTFDPCNSSALHKMWSAMNFFLWFSSS